MNKTILVLGCLLCTTLLPAQWTAKLATLDSTLTYLYEREMFNGTALAFDSQRASRGWYGRTCI